MEKDKLEVFEFWNDSSCGEQLYLNGVDEKESFANQSATRYKLEPFILPFADFKSGKGKSVLEIGVGLGADHQKWAEAGADLTGIDLTDRAIRYTKERLHLFGLSSKLSVADAENLPFASESFDQVYSWGVVHHTPDTRKALSEIYRVLKPGGDAKLMIYHKQSLVGYMLWTRYALLKLKPFTSLNKIYSRYLESPGTKAFTVKQAKEMFKDFSQVDIKTVLTHGDLLSSNVGQRHKGALISIARKLWPRKLIRSLLPNHGLFMLVHARK